MGSDMNYDKWKLKSDRDDEPDFPKIREVCENCGSTKFWQGISYELINNGIDTPYAEFTFQCKNIMDDEECGSEIEVEY